MNVEHGSIGQDDYVNLSQGCGSSRNWRRTTGELREELWRKAYFMGQSFVSRDQVKSLGH
jgi:hypothetical protein